jgi:hypothetical protein
MARPKASARNGLIALAVATGLASLGLSVANAGPAAIPAGTIHGCVTGSNRVLEHVYTSPDSGTTCPANSFQVIFPNGPFPSPSPTPTDTSPSPTPTPTPTPTSTSAITAGPGGLDEQVITFGNGSPNATAECPLDHPWVIGGGYLGSGIITDTPRTPQPPFTSTLDTGGWVVQGTSGPVAAIAICAQ